MSKKIEPCIDVLGRKLSWKPSVGDRLYGEVVQVFLKLYKPKKPKYDKQRFLRKYITVQLNDGRLMNFSAEQEDIKKHRFIADA